MRGPALSIVVPVYNGAGTLAALYKEIQAHVPPAFELIFVDDGSLDATPDCIRSLIARDNRVKAAFLSHNIGQQEATFCGLSLAGGEYVATMDADLQHAPALLPAMLSRLRGEGLDILYAAPDPPKSAPLRALGSQARDFLFFLIFKKSRGVRLSAYRVMTKALVARVLEQRSGFSYFSAIVFSMPVRAASMPAPFQADPEGGSRYTLTKRLLLFFKIFVYYGPLSAFIKKSPPGPFPIKELMSFA